MKANIKFKSLLDGIRNIEKRNKAFKNLSDEGKRLEIAWDTLKLLSNQIIFASNGHYWDYKLRSIFHNLERDKNTSHEFFKKLNVNSNIQSCEVCARGAVMLSQIRLGNTINPGSESINDVYKGTSELLDGFSYKSMRNMEAEYEFSAFKHPYKINTEEKLMNIMCNVLVNGDFNPRDKSDYLIS